MIGRHTGGYITGRLFTLQMGKVPAKLLAVAIPINVSLRALAAQPLAFLLCRTGAQKESEAAIAKAVAIYEQIGQQEELEQVKRMQERIAKQDLSGYSF